VALERSHLMAQQEFVGHFRHVVNLVDSDRPCQASDEAVEE
jgi:hypothetical protein